MDDRRDELDGWLHERIDPLPPPPGTFELIKRRARRRKFRQAAVSAGAVAAVAAAIIVVPRVTTALNVTPSEQGASSANGAAAAGSRASAPHSVLASASAQPPNSSAHNVPAPVTGPPPVPASFAPTSVTFIGSDTGWVIGQAGTSGQCATQYCTSVARTDSAGKTWSGGPAPRAGAPSGASGVSQIRFLNGTNGWAYGPALFATHDGGQHWAQVPTGGYRVTDLETVGDRAFAVFASCSGSGAAFAAGCTSFSLYSSVAGSDNWAPVPGPVTGLTAGGGTTSASLVLTGSRGYLLAPGGALYAGPVDGSGAWQQVSPGPGGVGTCGTGPAQPDGQPSAAFLAAATSSGLVLACAPAPGSAGAKVFTSSDGGTSWQQSGTAPGSSVVTSVAAQPGGETVLSTTAGLDVSHDGGASWQQLEQDPSGPAGGFSYVGLTSQQQGVAVPANPGEHAIWFTYDGGLSWAPSPIKG